MDMRLLAIDPGNEESALLEYDTESGDPMWFAKMPNDQALKELDVMERVDGVTIEHVASYGMAVGASVLDLHLDRAVH